MPFRQPNLNPRQYQKWPDTGGMHEPQFVTLRLAPDLKRDPRFPSSWPSRVPADADEIREGVSFETHVLDGVIHDVCPERQRRKSFT